MNINVNKKTLFLDIDGVLNPTHYNTALYKLSKASFGEIKYKDLYGDLFFNHNVDALKYIINETGCDLVISSTWKDEGLEFMKSLWSYRNLPGNIIDITPNEINVVNAGFTQFYDNVTRGMEIELWLTRNSYCGNYCIIDDINDFHTNQQQFFVKTDGNVGLTFKNANKAINILKQK